MKLILEGREDLVYPGQLLGRQYRVPREGARDAEEAAGK